MGIHSVNDTYNKEAIQMAYVLTVFDQKGDKLLDEIIEASTDEESKEQATILLKEHQYEEETHRLVSPDARLLLFHR